MKIVLRKVIKCVTLWSLFSISILIASCSRNDDSVSSQLPDNTNKALKYAGLLSTTNARKHLTILASDDYQGRETGKIGGQKAAEYIANEFAQLGLKAPVSDSYFQDVPFANATAKTANVLGYLEGTDLKDELLVISAHYDHLGMLSSGTDLIYNGADDDGSGTTALLELAKAFTQAKHEGNGPRRSILFLAVTGEEKGLVGSAWYTDHPIFPLNKTIADLNIDMIGRVDAAHQNNSNYCYLVGSDKLSRTLHQINENANTTYTQLNLDYKYNDPNDPERIYYRSDHYNFAKNNIPIIFYFDGIHEDYHKPSDEVSKINFDILIKRAKLIFHTGWELVNRDERPAVNMNSTQSKLQKNSPIPTPN